MLKNKQTKKKTLIICGNYWKPDLENVHLVMSLVLFFCTHTGGAFQCFQGVASSSADLYGVIYNQEQEKRMVYVRSDVSS